MKIKQLLLCLAFLFGSTTLLTAQSRHRHKTEHVKRAKTVHVRSYNKKSGKHVASYRRSSPHRK